MTDMENEVLTTEPEETVESAEIGWADENGVTAGTTIGEDDFYDPILDEINGNTPAEGEAAPTTEPAENEAEDAATGEEAPTTEPETQETPVINKLRFKAKVDHNDIDVELDESDLPTIYQKAQATDRAQTKLGAYSHTVDFADKLAAAMGYGGRDEMLKAAAENYRQSLLDELLESGTPQRIAEDYVNRQMGDLMNGFAAEAVDAQPTEPAPVAPSERDYVKEAGDLLAIRPELRGHNLPDEVTREAVENGVPLVRAYLDYEAKQKSAETERLRKENQILKQNAEAAARAPVKGTSDGGATNQKESDPFLEGFNSDW